MYNEAGLILMFCKMFTVQSGRIAIFICNVAWASPSQKLQEKYALPHFSCSVFFFVIFFFFLEDSGVHVQVCGTSILRDAEV